MSEETRGRRIVVGVTGGIAAYKAVSLVRELVVRGHDVTVIPTHSALQFVGLPTWEAVSRHDVSTELFDGVSEVRHVALGQSAELIIVAPATAHFLAQYAGGFASDLLGTTLLATAAPVVVAPAMHTEMWEHPATQENIRVLRSRGVHVVGPEVGPLTGGDVGPGRLSEPNDIVEAALAVLSPQTLAGKKVVVSAGGTREPLDPVRFIGNRSTGAMGVAIAHHAQMRGAEVVLVAAHLEVPVPHGVRVVSVSTAEEMRTAMHQEVPDADLVVMAAAVADFRPEAVSPEKIKKTPGISHLSLDLGVAPDIVSTLRALMRAGSTLVGFAAETASDDEELERLAREKLERKNLDVVVANRVGEQLGFGVTETAVWIIQRSGAPVLSTGSKMTVAGRLLDVLLNS